MKTFTVMGSKKFERRQIPFSFVEPFEAQALKNHTQSLDKLNSRGGLDATELFCVVFGRHWGHHGDLTEQQCWDAIEPFLKAHEEKIK